MKSRIGTAVTLPVFFSGSVRRSPRPSRAMIVCTSLLLVASVLFVGAGTNPGPASPATAKAKTEAAISSLPISFIENAGQTDPRIDFMLQGKGAVPSFTSHGVIWRLTDGKKAWVAKQSFVGAASEPIGIDPQETRFSWFKGDPDEWVTGARSYSGIRYEDLWPGIDLVYAGKDGALEYRFVVHPGADPGDIRVAYRGAEPSLLPSGDLRVRTPVRSLTERAPFTYQGREDEKAPVPSSFRLEGDTVAFRVGEYDRGRTLVVDPAILDYAGFIGGSGAEEGLGVAVDGTGAAYVTGITSSTEATFPETTGPDLTQNGGTDAFVAKVSADGTGLSYAGFIGGSGDDFGHGVAVDGTGAAYVAGMTSSTEATFPETTGPDLTQNGGTDAFVAKVSADGTGLSYAG
ncbi:MAG: SBBP repeat-containing protein, partial [Actinomycetota bacterium]